MAQPESRAKLTANDIVATPPGMRYQLLDGELAFIPESAGWRQGVLRRLHNAVKEFVIANQLGEVLLAPMEVVVSNYDVVQPDFMYIARTRTRLISCGALRAAPDLVVDLLSPDTPPAQVSYKQALYSRHGVREYWLVDPDAESVEVLAENPKGLAHFAKYQRTDSLISPLLPGLRVDLRSVFRGA